ncbi:TPA: nuclear transport factor 2 family protein [Streptococcus suis]|nr:nuclear transport factor 2 family protein [Streptococcus suis]HEM5082311.1 nuclear transport factor 2 family protein [Streptococcus suis]HEM5093556.1 nuclear transport factor 2 family protein [Streptococcus suis]HEM5116427.1 nuclear transport factor 2 family protein [Streptococcus suis]HEM5146862.1 nuclear transport factor 2 family protein [Streptococcus suis]
MTNQLENAKNLYLRGIRDGEIKEVHEHYMGATYTQHSTGVPDEKEGFAAFFEDFFKRNPKREISIVRAIEDGNFVFVHVHQKLNDGEAEWVTADIFRSDENGRIVEHWDVIDAYPKTIGQTDPIYADFELTDLDKTEDNKKIVRRFLVDVLQNGEIEKFDDYVAADLIQHNQEIAQGGAAYKDYLVDNQVNYDFVFKVMGQGDYVVAYSKVWIVGQDYAHFDIYRLKDGKIVEHWDNKEVMPEKKDLTNLGKF